MTGLLTRIARMSLPHVPAALCAAGCLAIFGGCATYSLIERAETRVVELPALSEPVPHEKGIAGYLGVKTGYSSQRTFHTIPTEGSDAPYEVRRSPTPLLAEGGLRFNLDTDMPGQPSLVDLFFKAGVDPERTGVRMGLLGVGLTSSPWLLNFRLATALGLHQYDYRIDTEEGSTIFCETNCDTVTHRTYEGNDWSQAMAWSATFWPTLCDPNSPCITPYIGAQYGITLVRSRLSFDGTALTAGLRASKGPIALVGAAHARRVQKLGTSANYWTADTRLEYAFRGK